jgi:hypothetical protein
VQVIDLDLKAAEAQMLELQFRLRAAPKDDRRLVNALTRALAVKRERVRRLRAAHDHEPPRAA